MNQLPILSILTFTPLAGALMLWLLPPENQRFARKVALGFNILTLLWVILLWLNFDASDGQYHFVEKHAWIESLGAQYYLGLDGISLLMVALAALITPIAIFATWHTDENVPRYYSLMLLLQTGLIGTFTALNFLHWFIFWELSLIPAFFLIKFWGGPNRAAAATRFFIYTMVGSVTMLLSFLAIFWATHSFDFPELTDLGQSGQLAALLNVKLQGWQIFNRYQLPLVIFAGVFLGFAVKVPLIPFHTWLPLTYTEASTGTTMLLTGVMSKMGVYGFLRILLPIFPDQMRHMLTPLLWLAVATIILSACAAFAQRDLKRIFAYSSINHLGYCLLGIFAAAKFTGGDEPWRTEQSAALNGVILQMFNHGLTASVLFCFIGFLEKRSGGLRGLNDFGGLRKVAPIFCGLMGISIFASLGLPGLNGFIGEFLIFKGAFALVTWATALSVIGLLVTAIFLLTVIQRVFNGPLNPKWSALPDLNWRERFIVLPATALMFLIGLYPQFLIGKINAAVLRIVEQLRF
ncbi:MAG TPA: NADH-quinone oxidoreductase subunit M [Verrucomicrobiae bacterium]|jgi:NADH-quinone oxidoreductase subunit M|nr:NADH-quinone oxidoreductase subunit M [Verrucomicrobiae bacterium]